MATVRILPLDAGIVVAPGEALMGAAQRQGYWWPMICDGNCECGTCWLLVETGAEHCSPIGSEERATLAKGMKAKEPRARLACQMTVTGPVTVTRRGVRRVTTSTLLAQRGTQRDARPGDGPGPAPHGDDLTGATVPPPSRAAT